MSSRADGSIVIDTQVDTRGVKEGSSKIEGMFNKTISAAKKVGAAIAAAFAIKKIVDFSKACIELGSDLEEVQNVVDVTFGEMSNVINDWAKNAAVQFGMSELSAKQYTSTIGAMLKSMGFSTDAATEMSVKMAELAGDMASFYNLETDEAFAKIRSGISGETEPLKQLGINLSEANLEQYRMSQGIETSYRNMSQMDKALLRYNYLLSVTSDAQGDFARTSGSWANQMKILKLQIQSIMADLGQGLINLLIPVLKMINTLLQGIAKLASAFKAFTALITGQKADTSASAGSGISETASDYSAAADSAADYADATDNAAEATKKANKEARKYTTSLDRIHQYQAASADTGSTGGKGKTTPSTSSGTSLPVSSIDFGTLSKGDTVVDKLAAKMKSLYDYILKATEPVRKALVNLWENGLSRLGSFTWTALQDFYNDFLVPVGSWVMGEGLPRFINALNSGLMNINWERINTGLRNLWQALAPFAIKIGEGLLWFWENVLVPLGTWVYNEAVPRYLESIKNVIRILSVVIDWLKPLWSWFWEKVLLPVAKWTGGIFVKVWDKINRLLDDFATWCEEHPTLEAAWDSIRNKIVEVADGIFRKLDEWFEPLKELWDKGWGAVKKTAEDTWGKIQTTLSKKWGEIKTNATTTFESIEKKIGTAWDNSFAGSIITWEELKGKLKTAWEAIKTNASTIFGNIQTTVEGVWRFIKTLSSGDWEGIKTTISTAMDNIATKASEMGGLVKTAFVNMFTGAYNLMRTPINAIIRAINAMIRGVVNGINSVIDSLNRLAFTIPSWVPFYGGNRFGLDISRITHYPVIPQLATGAVIPPNAPFAAILGDQKNGNNIEAPESLIRRIVREESGNGKNGKYEFKAVLNRRVLFDEIISEAKLRQQLSAVNPFDLA